jgi:hypothetical protein
VDCQDVMETLDWAPGRAIDDALREMALAAKGAR